MKNSALVALTAVCTSAFAADWYVATNGNDGSAGSLAAPFASIQHAVDTMSAGDTVYVRGGRYHEEVVISNMVGSAGSKYTLTNYGSEQPVLDGTIPIAGTWTTTNLNGHSVWVTPVGQDIWQLFVDDRMQVVARWPNVTVGHPCDPIQLQADGYTPETNTWWDIGTWGAMANSWNAGGNLTNNASVHDLAAEGVSFAGGSIVLNFHSESQFSRNILSHQAGSNALVHEPVDAPYDKGSGPFLIEHLNALDIPGEWYYDRSTGLVWFWPLAGQDPNTMNIRGKTISYGITMRNSRHWNVVNLDFFASTIDAQQSEYVMLDDCLFSYPTWFRRMLGEHTYWYKLVNGQPQAKSEPMGEGGTFLMGDKNGSYNTIRNCVFEYSDGRVDMNNGYGNVVENNLFHHWSFSGMASFVLNMNSSPNSIQRRNTFHTNGSKVMSKHSFTDVEYSRAYYFGYFQQDGSAWQCAGGNGAGGGSDGRRRSHNWHHQAMKGGGRWDGHDGVSGTNDHMVSWLVPASLMVKGDYHATHNNVAIFAHDPTDNMIKLLDSDERNPPSVRNANSQTYNNLADSISAARSGYTPLNGYETNNWNGYLHTSPGDTADNQLRDPLNLDFRPKAISDLIDQGTWVSGINDDYGGSAPDIGAYEFGCTNYWIPGYQAVEAGTPIPPNGTPTAKTDADLMWLEGRDALSHDVYFGTISGGLAFMTNQMNNIFDPGPLVEQQTYYWRIDEVTSTGIVTGTEWSFTPGSLKATTFTTLYAIADASVRTNNPTTNYGSSSSLELANYPLASNPRYDRRAFVKFDVNVTGKVVSAELKLHRSSATSNVDVETYSMSDTSWNESTVTWNTQPAIDGVLLDANQVNGGSNWASFVVTDGVTNGLVSLALLKPEGGGRRAVDSRDSAWPPELIVEYEIPFPDPPAAPQNLVASAGLNQISLDWADNTEAFLAGYHVYRTDYLDDDFVRINATTLTNSSFIDTTAVPGVTNYYKVRAVDDYGQLSAGTPYASAIASGGGGGNATNWVELTYDDFESGFGNYTDGGADCSLYVTTSYAHQGSNAVDIQRNGTAGSFAHTNGIDVDAPAYTQLKIEFWFYPKSMEPSATPPDNFFVQYFDGSSWLTLRDYVSGVDFTNDVFQFETLFVDESSTLFPSNMKVRFMCDANGGGDDIYIDEVRVSALEITAGPSPYEGWMTDYGLSGTNAVFSADPDSDGLDNLLEYGLGGIPTNGGDSALLPDSGIVVDSGTNWMEYIYRRRTDAAMRGLGYYLELCSDLVSNSWSSTGYSETGTAPLETGFEAVTNRIPTETEINRFIRLRISIE